MKKQKARPRKGWGSMKAPPRPPGRGRKRRRDSSGDTSDGARPAPFSQRSVARSSAQTAKVPRKAASRPKSTVASPSVSAVKSSVPHLMKATPQSAITISTTVPGLGSGEVMNDNVRANTTQLTKWEDIKRYLSPHCIGSLESLQLPELPPPAAGQNPLALELGFPIHAYGVHGLVADVQQAQNIHIARLVVHLIESIRYARFTFDLTSRGTPPTSGRSRHRSMSASAVSSTVSRKTDIGFDQCGGAAVKDHAGITVIKESQQGDQLEDPEEVEEVEDLEDSDGECNSDQRFRSCACCWDTIHKCFGIYY